MASYRSKPPKGATLNRGDRLAKGLIGAWLFDEKGGVSLRDTVGRRVATYSGAASPPTHWTTSPRGPAVKFNGSSQYASIPLDLSPYTSLTLAWGMTWDAFSSGDNMAMEFTSNQNANAGGFYVDPNGSTAAGFELKTGGNGSNNGTLAGFTRPSAAAWHDYLCVFDRAVSSNATIPLVCVDGAPQSLSYTVVTGGTGPFANSTLYLMSRAGASLWGAGQLGYLFIWGNRKLVEKDARDLAADPFRAFRRRPVALLKTSAGGTAYTLAAAPGSFALSGQPAATFRGRILAAATGVYNLTGVAARTLTARLLGAAAGAFALTGRAALLLQGGRHLAGGRFARPVWLRLFPRSEWSRTLARPVWLRSWRYSAVISKTTLKKTAGEDRDFLFDFSRAPEILAGATVASATVAAESGLTVGSGVVLAAALDGVAAGQGVTCEVSGGTAGTTYDVSCTATLSTGRKLVLPGTVAVFSDFGR